MKQEAKAIQLVLKLSLTTNPFHNKIARFKIGDVILVVKKYSFAENSRSKHNRKMCVGQEREYMKLIEYTGKLL